MYGHVQQISPGASYHKAKAEYSELAAGQSVWKTPAKNINVAYQAELAKFLPTPPPAQPKLSRRRSEFLVHKPCKAIHQTNGACPHKHHHGGDHLIGA